MHMLPNFLLQKNCTMKSFLPPSAPLSPPLLFILAPHFLCHGYDLQPLSKILHPPLVCARDSACGVEGGVAIGAKGAAFHMNGEVCVCVCGGGGGGLDLGWSPLPLIVNQFQGVGRTVKVHILECHSVEWLSLHQAGCGLSRNDWSPPTIVPPNQILEKKMVLGDQYFLERSVPLLKIWSPFL